MAIIRKPKEGELIALPIEDRYAIGLVTRINNSKIPLGYFYDTLFRHIPQITECLSINFQTPILIVEFGSQGLKDETWKILGSLPNFKKSDFPVPIFFHYTKPFKPQLVFFDDNMNEETRQIIEESEVEKYEDYPKIGLGGSGFVEKVLRKMIAPLAPI